METTLYSYTGTGNSLWIAQKLGERLGNAECIPITRAGANRIQPAFRTVGFIFPVHIWGIPSRVVDFLNRLEADPSKYYFAVAVHAGQVAATLIQLEKLLHRKTLKLSAGFSIAMPSNYIPWNGADPPEKQQRTFAAATAKLDCIASSVLSRQETDPEKGPFWQNILFSLFYRWTFSRVAGMDKAFSSDDKCTQCGICEKICPAQNIDLVQGKPCWKHHCDQCLACIQWCPEEAIQYGKSSAHKKRYHHPEISLKQMLACAHQDGHKR